jgi:hypothetical protein
MKSRFIHESVKNGPFSFVHPVPPPVEMESSFVYESVLASSFFFLLIFPFFIFLFPFFPSSLGASGRPWIYFVIFSYSRKVARIGVSKRQYKCGFSTPH